jgi:hypothetical protein
LDCLSNFNEAIEIPARKAYHSISQGALETLVQSSDQLCAKYRSYKKSFPNVDISQKDQAMDFFHGLDNDRYGLFKARMMNGIR